MPASSPLFGVKLRILPVLLFAATSTFASAAVSGPLLESSNSNNALTRPKETLAAFLDRIPDLVEDQGLPSFAPEGAVRLSLRPRFGDLLHESYFRLPVGARLKIKDQLEINGELGSYFTHGLRDNVGYGLYQFRLGLKREEALSADSGLSYGVDFSTPLSHPPREITDGLRHTVPYVTYTRKIPQARGLVAFATFAADLLDYTSITPNYSENELRANSLVLTLGVAREWRRMHVILRVFDGNTAPLSNISQNVFGFRPSVGVPFLRRPDGTPRFIATFAGRAVWGPDGFETGVNTSVRFDLRYKSSKPARTTP
jgi:hypothetical protein